MARIIKVKTIQNKIHFINIDNIIRITPFYSDPTDKNGKDVYSIYFVDGSFINDCILQDTLKEELHLG